MNPIEARAALDSIDDVQRDLALQGATYPLWRHAAFAAVMAALVLGQGFALPIQMALFVPAMAGLAWIVADDRRRYGLFVNGYRKGRTLPVTLVLVAVMLGAMGGELYARFNGGSLALKLGIAGLAFGVALGASLWWTRLYHRELMKGGL